jgi:hypothetical protein
VARSLDGLLELALGEIHQAQIVVGGDEGGQPAEQLLTGFAPLLKVPRVQRNVDAIVQRSQLDPVGACQPQSGQQLVQRRL